MKVVYIAGPFRGSNAWEIECNIRAAEELALEVWRLGAAALCPHTNTRFFQGAAPDEVWLEGTLELMYRCDAVLLLPTWERSSGARIEKEHAEKRGIPVFADLWALNTWLVKGSHKTNARSGYHSGCTCDRMEGGKRCAWCLEVEARTIGGNVGGKDEAARE